MSVITDIGKIQNKGLEYKRQHLWVLSINGIDSWTVQSAERPKLNMGTSMQVNYLTTYARFQGARGQWSPINITLNDPIEPSSSKSVYQMILAQWNYGTGRVGSKAQYAGDFSLKLLSPDFESVGNEASTVMPEEFDENGMLSKTINSSSRNNVLKLAGTGKFIERWDFKNAFFENVDWNGAPLDYDNTDRLKVSFTLNYDYAKLISNPS